MDQFVIEGGERLTGEVVISGSKNASLPILAATLLADGECVIENVPHLADVNTLMKILQRLGVDIQRRADGAIVSRVVDTQAVTAPYELVREMRASICVLGPLLGRRRQAKVAFPGGCVIGVRPVDLHLKGLAALGAQINIVHGYIEADATTFQGNEIFLGGAFGSSVLGTANVLMAAVLAPGVTVIESAACEPEVQDLAHFLIKMGADIQGAGTHRLVVRGVSRLNGTHYRIIPDRIEAGTFMVAAALTRGDITIRQVCRDHLTAVLDKFQQIGVTVEHPDRETIRVRMENDYHSTDLVTLPYPGFPTDLQAQFCALLSLADGISVITEKIFPDRFMHVAELNRMGARIRKEGPSAIICGVGELSGAPVMASDLRASAGLVLAGLVAKGTTRVDRIYHIDRGYENIEDKLTKLGARVQRVKS